MSQPESSPSYFKRRWESSGSTDESAEYKKVCPSAIVACILATISPLAFFHPLLWVIPIIAIAVCAWAALAIARQPEELLGRRALLCAMAVTVFCGLTAYTDWAVYRYYLQTEAHSFADLWLEKILNDKPLEAYQLFSHPLNRRLPGRGLEDQYSSGSKNREDFEKYMKNELLQILSDHDLKPSCKYQKVVGFSENPFAEIVTLQYELSWEAMDGPKSKPIQISMTRMKLVDVPLAGWKMQDAAF